MDFVKNIRAVEERAETGFGAQIDRPATVFDSGKVCRIGVSEDAPAQCDEAWIFLRLEGFERHRFFYFCLTSAMKTSNGLTVNPCGSLVVLRRSALENRIWRL
jgi:hypothetical protein